MPSADHLVTRRTMLAQAGGAALAASLAGRGLPAFAAEPAEVPDNPLRSDHKIRVGIVGGRFGSTFHFHEHPNCIVHAVSDLRTDRRDTLMKTYHCERAYESLEKMLLDKEIEAVALFTGAPDHARHVLMTMNAGKHVLSAVPACLNLEDAARMKEAKIKTGLKYMMAETSYYRSHCIAARKLFQEGAFGHLFYSEVEYYHPRIAGQSDTLSMEDGQRTWRYGYAPMLYPTHSTGLLVGVTKERLTEVSCLGWTRPDEAAFIDNAYENPFSSCMALFKTSGGNMCRCGVFWDGQSHGERGQWFGTNLTFYMPGNHGGLVMTGPGAPKWTDVPNFWEMLPKPMRHDSGHGGSHTFITHEFIAALVEQREPAVDLYEALAMTVPGIVAHESALKGGEQLKVPSFDEA